MDNVREGELAGWVVGGASALGLGLKGVDNAERLLVEEVKKAIGITPPRGGGCRTEGKRANAAR